MKIKVEGLTVEVSMYPKKVVLTFDDMDSLQHFVLNITGFELGITG